LFEQGHYVLEMEATEWSPQSVRRFFVALGPHRARPIVGELLLCALDAAHLRSVFLGRMWVLTHLDANKELTILAFGAGASEDADDASWFIAQCRRVYPSLAALIHDQGTALLNGAVGGAAVRRG
jgi:hypothetical protein